MSLPAGCVHLSTSLFCVRVVPVLCLARYSIVNAVPFALVGTSVVTTGPLDFESTRTLALTVQSMDDSGASVR